MTRSLAGSCHCGRVRWHFEGPVEAATICNCTVCRRYGVLWIYGFEGSDVRVDDPEAALKSYLCGHRAISFNFCGNCGNVVSWRSVKPETDGRTRMAVNIRLSEPEDVASLPLVQFDGLHSFEDLPWDRRHVSDVWF